MTDDTSEEPARPPQAGDAESARRRLMAAGAAAGHAAGDPLALMTAFAEAQRAAGRGLRAAVELGRAQGLSWRALAEALDVPASSLHRQFGRGDALTTPPEPDAEPVARPSGPPARFDLFVGRLRELADLPGLLRRSRLVSLVGPAGVGKTRLAAEIADRVRPAFPAGVWWVDLAVVTREWHIGPAVSAAAGPAHAGRDARHVAAEAARAGRLLIVLDNCEHLTDAVARFVAELHAAAPQARVLITSREATGAAGEAVLPLAPLPSAGHRRGEARGADVVRLFAARARDVKPDFDTDRWVEVIVDICERLDRLPLAIELAARQSDLLEPDRLRARLAEPLDVLTGPSPDRRGSLRDAIRRSYDLLDDTAKVVYARLCVLPGGFDQHTAAAVTADLGLTAPQVWAVLAGLARTSMVVAAPGRFRILESLRSFGQEVLADEDRLAAHAGLIAWLAAFERGIAGNTWGSAFTAEDNQMAAELDNVRYAVDVSAPPGHDRHHTLVLLLANLLSMRQEQDESNRLLAGLSDDPRASVADRAVAAWITSVNTGRLGDLAAATRHADTAVALARSLDDPDLLTEALISVMIARGLSGDLDGGIDVGAGLLARLRTTRPGGSLGRVLTIQASLLMGRGDVDAAWDAVTEAFALHEKDADPALSMSDRFANHWAAYLLSTAADVAIARGDDPTAITYLTAVLAGRFHHHHAVVGALQCLAFLAARQGRNERALTLAAGVAGIGYQRNGFRDAPLAAAMRAAELAVGPAAARAAADRGRALTVADLKRYAIDDTAPADEGLTPRRREVARHIAGGLTNAQIAARLGISERTVASHVADIRRALDLRSRIDIALWAAHRPPS
jgi:predicted ATPase/DNA-binding NarL/FixJ family response regulator